MEKIENETCACIHCENVSIDNSKCCYACFYTKSCQVELREDWIFRRGYYAEKA
jgi:hypothetical protein